ncbi:hypothetical protein SETIT_4G168000v2 [Setaria italica]|uniref:Uncharacterized protein n=2 Tax=Setaria TaxID=4554 RepID=A0A368QV31_SETIT|nr:hypothetical protein SETIT_4G168000v2 [Setaria italica]TKW21678.1 hypothetical protein SEVIR_4G136000v2 [Setaria viridis]
MNTTIMRRRPREHDTSSHFLPQYLTRVPAPGSALKGKGSEAPAPRRLQVETPVTPRGGLICSQAPSDAMGHLPPRALLAAAHCSLCKNGFAVLAITGDKIQLLVLEKEKSD